MFIGVGVIRIVWMSFWTMCLFKIQRAWAFTDHRIVQARDLLKVLRIDAPSVSALVIDGQTINEWSVKMLVRKSMSFSANESVEIEFPVPIFV
jgi:hypothetical protein